MANNVQAQWGTFQWGKLQWGGLAPAPWLSGIVDQFFVEAYTLVIVPGQVVSATITLFDQAQGSIA